MNPASEAADIVDYDSVRSIAVLAQESQHSLHSWAIDKATRRIIGEDLYHLLVSVLRKLAAACLL